MHMQNDLGFITAFVPGFFGKSLTFFKGAADQIIEGKQTWDQTKSAWKGTLPGGASIATPGVTGERFSPATTQIAAPLPIGNLTRAEIREVQDFLSDRGYNPGPLDGLFGPKTKAAIERFQGSNNFITDGIPSRDLLSRIRAFADEIIVTGRRTATAPPISPGGVPPYRTFFQPAPAVIQQSTGMPPWAIPALLAAGFGALILTRK